MFLKNKVHFTNIVIYFGIYNGLDKKIQCKLLTHTNRNKDHFVIATDSNTDNDFAVYLCFQQHS